MDNQNCGKIKDGHMGDDLPIETERYPKIKIYSKDGLRCGVANPADSKIILKYLVTCMLLILKNIMHTSHDWALAQAGLGRQTESQKTEH